MTNNPDGLSDARARLQEAVDRRLGFRRGIIGTDRVVVTRADLAALLAHSEPRPAAGEDVAIVHACAQIAEDHEKSVGLSSSETARAIKWAILDKKGSLATHIPAPTEAGEVERLRKMLSDLERSATVVHRKGITAGPQWSRLGGDLIRARASLTSSQGGVQR